MSHARELGLSFGVRLALERVDRIDDMIGLLITNARTNGRCVRALRLHDTARELRVRLRALLGPVKYPET